MDHSEISQCLKSEFYTSVESDWPMAIIKVTEEKRKALMTDKSNSSSKIRTEFYERSFGQASIGAIIIITVLFTVVSIVGLIGNYFVIIVFSKHIKQAVSNLFITFLAIIDMIICVVDIPMTLYWFVWGKQSMDIMCKLLVFLKAFCVPVSALILVMIAIDRFLIICFIPSILIRKKTSVIILFLVFLVGIILAVPVGLHTGTKMYLAITDKDVLMRRFLGDSKMNLTSHRNINFSPQRNVTKKEIQLLQWGSCSTDQAFISKHNYSYYQMGLFVLFTFLMVLIIVFYSIIFIFLWMKHRKMRTYKNPNHKKQKEFSISLSSNLLRMKSLHKRKSLNRHSVDIDEPSISCSSNLKRQNSHRRRKPHVKTAYTLALIAATFIVSYLPYLLISNEFVFVMTSRDQIGNQKHKGKYFYYLRQSLFYFYFLNSAINPIIYSVTNNQFKSDMKKLKIVKCFTRV